MKGILAVVLPVIIISCSSPSKKEEKKQASPKNDLPNMILNSISGESLIAKNLKGKNVLVLFQPDCDHCQREAIQFKEHIEAFKDYTLYFVSSDTPQNIMKFAEDYQLSGFNNVHFAWAETQSILNNFGSIPTPSVYIYNNMGKLMIRFNGETDINVILKGL